jgi:4-alpha-glucanotransferase
VTGATEQLVALAHAYGVATEYHDWRDRHVQVPTETVEAVLEAMGVDITDPDAALQRRIEEPWRRTLPVCVVARQGSTRRVPVHVPHGDPAELWVVLEGGGRRDAVQQLDYWIEPREVDGRLVGEATFALPEDLPLGYHRLHVRSGDVEAATTLIVTPDRLELPDALRHGGPGWGFAAQLYSVRSAASWGVGDLTDLETLATWSAGLGADYVLVNPLHAAEPTAPMEPSPYLPSSRMFFNPLYLRVEQIAEYDALSPAARKRVDELARATTAPPGPEELIDRDSAWTAKREALRLVYDVPRSAAREQDLESYRAREGRSLRDFATWSVLAEKHGTDYRTWPVELQDSAASAVAAAAAEHADDIGFAEWLQWVLDEQLAAVQREALAAGMTLGTMHDLAVGVHPGGADAWRMRTSYATGITVGAPPDPFNQQGQNWSQPPWRPNALEELGYAPFRELIASVLRHAGGVRIDHIIGLFRLWWVPEGRSPAEGTYVRYDHEAVIGVLALEAARAGAVVVGEDLGVVEPSAREYLAARGILGTSILWFERDHGGQPLPAEHWRELCLASVTTHDLPPTAGFLAAGHVRLRHELGLLSRSLEEEVAADEAERGSWLQEVRSRGLLDEGAEVEETVQALHRYLTLTPSVLRCVALTDAVGDRRTQNQPGTHNEYPNWRIPLSGPDERPILLEEVLASERARALAEVVTALSPRARSV